MLTPRVHPRVRGGDAAARSASNNRRGSSPRARGRRRLLLCGGQLHGFIPACAGETTTATSTGPPTKVHPRVRGGDSGRYEASADSTGSSPRARGRLERQEPRGLGAGFIPACAGETPARRVISPGSRVHPRVRGGDYTLGTRRPAGEGSSPRARGRHRAGGSWCRRLRFIPACAGETADDGSLSPLSEVHPRVRGGDGTFDAVPMSTPGSSPRARGRQRAAGSLTRRRGFIPACAGETLAMCVAETSEAVHPRVRGGDSVDIDGEPLRLGSSPRARGRHRHGDLSAAVARFIPACAGETLGRVVAFGHQGVHPRVRGGDGGFFPTHRSVGGSSPRARGRQLR